MRTNSATCKKCKLPLSFVMISGKLHPRNPDGSDHFDLCSATRTAAAIKRGVGFTDDQGSGFIVDGKKMHMIMPSKTITGKYYVKSTDTSVPWLG